MDDFASWEELHGFWPCEMAAALNEILPPGYRSGPNIRLGTAVEVDVGTYLHESTNGSASGPNEGGSVLWSPEAATVVLDTEEPTPPEYETRVYDMRHARRLIAAVEIVSPSNKDRPASRDAFVAKCHGLLQEDVCVAIVDPVTVRNFNLYAELLDRLGADPPPVADGTIYAVTCRGHFTRGRWRVEAWPHTLAVGSPLPILPLWLTETIYVPLDL